jgi:hypothetical protein
MVRLGVWFLFVWALDIACSCAVVSLLWQNSGRDTDVPVHVVSVRGSDDNILFSGSSE